MPTETSNPRPKRSADKWTRTHYQEDAGSSKKARFDLRNPSALAPDVSDDDEEDVFLEADELTKRGNQTKRNAVNIDGFESDSSNEAFDERATAKAKRDKIAATATSSKNAEDDDMFADLEEDEVPDGDEDEALGQGGKRKKAVHFADLDQVADLEEIKNSKSGGHVHAHLRDGEVPEDESSSDESEVDDEARARLDDTTDVELGAGSKKKHAPRLAAFNLNEEREEGKFDESLNFVRKATDADSALDSWLQGTSKKEIRKAKEAQVVREQTQRQKMLDNDALDTGELLGGLIAQLQPGETSLTALARLAPKKEKKGPKWQNRNAKARKGKMDPDEVLPTPDEAELERRRKVDEITGSSDVLMQRGVIDINDSRELLKRHYRKEVGADWSADRPISGSMDSSEADYWEFRWPGTEEVQGPEPREKMKAWIEAGYFDGDTELRIAGTKGPWRTNVTF